MSIGKNKCNRRRGCFFAQNYLFSLVDMETIMFKKTLTITVLSSVLVFTAGSALAGDQDRDQTRDRDQTQLQDQTKDQTQDKTQDKTQDQIYGSQLMTQQERNEYRNRIHSAKTAQEQEQIRAEHHEQMQARAKERGMTLPDYPPASGSGMGPGGGMGQGGGMGPGGGMRPGGGY